MISHFPKRNAYNLLIDMSHQFEIHTRNNLDYVYDIEGFPQH